MSRTKEAPRRSKPVCGQIFNQAFGLRLKEMYRSPLVGIAVSNAGKMSPSSQPSNSKYNTCAIVIQRRTRISQKRLRVQTVQTWIMLLRRLVVFNRALLNRQGSRRGRESATHHSITHVEWCRMYLRTPTTTNQLCRSELHIEAGII